MPTGRIHISIQNARSLNYWLCRKWWFSLDVPRHLFSFTPKTIEKLLFPFGLKVKVLWFESGERSCLASIQYFVDGIRKTRDNYKINKFLDLMMESSNDAQEKIRDIIWTVNPREDGLSKFFIKFKRHASDLFDSHNINYEINFPYRHLLHITFNFTLLAPS